MSKHTPDYGEPWAYGTHTNTARTRVDGNMNDEPVRVKRAVACVNALAGRNPEAVGDVETALKRAVAVIAEVLAVGHGCDSYRSVYRDARAALTKFREV